MSRKFVLCWFAKAVILSPRLLKMRVRSFLALSPSLLDFVFRTARPSSR